MKLLMVCPYDLGAPGGVQRQCFELVEHLRRTGDEASLLGPGSGDEWVGIGRTIAIEANGSRVPFTIDPTSFRRIEEAAAGVDVVHVHEPFVPLAGWAALRTGRPTVATFHADPSTLVRRSYRWGSFAFERALGRARTTAVSPVAASALPPAWGPPTLVPNGLNVDSYRVDVDRQASRVVFLGRDDPRKGLDVILEAWPEVRSHHGDAELLVVGAERPSAPPGVTYAGRVSEADKRRHLASSGIYVAPNLAGESFGIVVAEAMAAGCAIVASDLPAFRAVTPEAEFVTPGEPQRWSAALRDLLDDRGRIAESGERSRADVRRFDWPHVVDRYRGVYAEARAA